MNQERLPVKKKSEWTFLSNHAHVLICLELDPDMVLREVALKVGITERAVQKIVTDLEEAGALSRQREGRRNHYQINRRLRLRHPLENHAEIGQLLEVVAGSGK
jgi:predicted transcriptional regulator